MKQQQKKSHLIRSIKGKYAFIPTNTYNFIVDRSKEIEVEIEKNDKILPQLKGVDDNSIKLFNAQLKEYIRYIQDDITRLNKTCETIISSLESTINLIEYLNNKK